MRLCVHNNNKLGSRIAHYYTGYWTAAVRLMISRGGLVSFRLRGDGRGVRRPAGMLVGGTVAAVAAATGA